MYIDTVFVLKCTQTQSMCWSVHKTHSMCRNVYRHSLCVQMYRDTIIYQLSYIPAHSYFGMEDNSSHKVYVLKCTQTKSLCWNVHRHSLRVEMYTDTVFVLKCTQTQSMCWNVHKTQSMCRNVYRHSLCVEMYTDTQSMCRNVYRHSLCVQMYRDTVYVLKCIQTLLLWDILQPHLLWDGRRWLSRSLCVEMYRDTLAVICATAAQSCPWKRRGWNSSAEEKVFHMRKGQQQSSAFPVSFSAVCGGQ